MDTHTHTHTHKRTDRQTDGETDRHYEANFFFFFQIFSNTPKLLDLDAGLLARSQNPEGPATGHLDPGFLGFPGS